mgnify:CR=1 FL=1
MHTHTLSLRNVFLVLFNTCTRTLTPHLQPQCLLQQRQHPIQPPLQRCTAGVDVGPQRTQRRRQRCVGGGVARLDGGGDHTHCVHGTGSRRRRRVGVGHGAGQGGKQQARASYGRCEAGGCWRR